MRTVGAAMVSFAFFFYLFCAPASAFCDLKGYDRTAPAAIQGDVSNQFADFQWSSDVDTLYDRTWIWHYILNRNDRSLGAIWEKAGIRIPLLNPLPSGKAFCNRFLADSVLPKPDTDAPIIYGTNQQQQPAAIFVAEKPPKLGQTSSRITTSYIRDGKSVDVDVVLATFQSPSGFFIDIEHSPGFVVGVSGISQALSSEQFATLAGSAEKQNGFVARATFAQFTKSGTAQSLAPLYREQDRPNEKTDFLFFSGPPAMKVEVPAKQIRKISADMIVLEQETMRPIFATDVSLLVPANQ
jgi:hypothetical protein